MQHLGACNISETARSIATKFRRIVVCDKIQAMNGLPKLTIGPLAATMSFYIIRNNSEMAGRIAAKFD